MRTCREIKVFVHLSYSKTSKLNCAPNPALCRGTTSSTRCSSTSPTCARRSRRTGPTPPHSPPPPMSTGTVPSYILLLSSFCANNFTSGSGSFMIIPSFRLSRPMTRGISPAEINGLISVLRLVAAVASNCEAARVAIAENTAWQPLLLGWPRPRIGLHRKYFRKVFCLKMPMQANVKIPEKGLRVARL